MTKRERIKNKYDGLCAYTGKPLDEKWQIDHIHPKCYGGSNDESNIVPTIRIINHYKRSHDLSTFRQYISTLHLRLRKLPKKTIVKRTQERIKYLKEVAALFDIDEYKPFDGKFYFETIKEVI